MNEKLYFDTSNWQKYKVHYFIILIVVIIIVIIIMNHQEVEQRGRGKRTRGDGNGDIYYLGRGSEQDSVAVLIDRIEWSAYLDKRTTLWQRVIITTFVVMFFVIALVLRKLPTPGTIILLFFTIFIPIYATHQLFYVHGDVYNDYYIKTNAELLREKLNLEKNDPPEPADNIPDRPYVM
jgi:hypothetical protein